MHVENMNVHKLSKTELTMFWKNTRALVWRHSSFITVVLVTTIVILTGGFRLPLLRGLKKSYFQCQWYTTFSGLLKAIVLDINAILNTTLSINFYYIMFIISNRIRVLWRYFSRQVHIYDSMIFEIFNLTICGDISSQNFKCFTLFLSKTTAPEKVHIQMCALQRVQMGVLQLPVLNFFQREWKLDSTSSPRQLCLPPCCRTC